MRKVNPEMEHALVKFANEEMFEYDIDIRHYQKVEFYIYNDNVLKELLRKCKFKDLGNVYDYAESLPQPQAIDGYDLTNNFELFHRIAISEKMNAIAYYTINDYEIYCMFLVDIEKLKKFSKLAKKILQQDSRANLFREIDFDCKKGEYIEIADAQGDSMKPADVVKKKISKETLVFHETSTIVEVMNDIHTFFKKETRKMYERMEIAYKRGVILYGNPGNGKSAMIREIIRVVPKITKIIINPNVSNVTRVLSALIKALDGKQAIVVIEDIDSLITDRNRSDFLNILDGVDVKSGIFFIGTTNYPDQIDPAFMNRSGRFDRTYKIDDPSEEVRRKFFESRNIGELLAEHKVFRDSNIPDSNSGVVELFVKHSNELPMASLKELITATKYLLASNDQMTVEEAVETSYNVLTQSRAAHAEAHENYRSSRDIMRRRRYGRDD